MAMSTAINITKGSNLGKLVVAIRQQEAKFESQKNGRSWRQILTKKVLFTTVISLKICVRQNNLCASSVTLNYITFIEWFFRLQSEIVTILWQHALFRPKIDCIGRNFEPFDPFLESPETFRAHSGGIILFASSKRKRLEVRNFAVILIFIPFTTYHKKLLYRISGSQLYEWLFGPDTFSGLLRNGPLYSHFITHMFTLS